MIASFERPLIVEVVAASIRITIRGRSVQGVELGWGVLPWDGGTTSWRLRLKLLRWPTRLASRRRQVTTPTVRAIAPGMDTSRIRGPVRRPMSSAEARIEAAARMPSTSRSVTPSASWIGIRRRLFRLGVVAGSAEDSWVLWRVDAPSLAGCGGLGGRRRPG